MPEIRTLEESLSPGMSLVNQFLFVNLHNRSNYIGRWQENSLLLHLKNEAWMEEAAGAQCQPQLLSLPSILLGVTGLPAHGNWIRNTSQELFRWFFDSDEESMFLKRIIRVEAPFFVEKVVLQVISEASLQASSEVGPDCSGVEYLLPCETEARWTLDFGNWNCILLHTVHYLYW